MKLFRQSYQNLLIETQIFPPIATMGLFIHSNSLCIEACENYQKRSFRNRYHIGSHQGLLALSVPLLKGKNNQQLITEVAISYESPWPSVHWKAIQSSYGKSAYFIYYKDMIQELLFAKPRHLFQLNHTILQTLCKELEIEISIRETHEFAVNPTDPSILDFRSKMIPRELSRFSFPEYYQVYSSSSGFIPNLSILDLLFHLGPDSLGYLSELEML